MVAEGLTWIVANTQGVDFTPLHVLSILSGALDVAIFAHLILSFPMGLIETHLTRLVVGFAYGVMLLHGLFQMMSLDPNPGILNNLLASREINIALALICVAVIGRRWAFSSPATRRALTPPCATLLMVAVGVGWSMLHVVPAGPVFAFAGLIEPEVIRATVPVAFLVGLLRLRLRRAVVTDLVILMSASPSAARIRARLACTLGDLSLELGIWDPERGRYIDSDGGVLEPTPTHSRAVTPIGETAQPLAVLVHDPSLTEDQELLDMVAATIRLGLENASLWAEVGDRALRMRALAVDVARSAHGDQRLLESNLRDGAERRLMSALATLHQTAVELPSSSVPGLRATVSAAAHELRLALDELNELARGTRPAILVRDGLGPAVRARAVGAAVPVTVRIPDERYPAHVELTAYFVVCEALTNAIKHARATAVCVCGERIRGRLSLEVVDDGAGGADPSQGSGLSGLASRVAAMGGVLHVVSPVGRGTRIRAWLPCD